MADDKQEQENLVAKDLPVTIHAQYVRDLSFENPHAPDTLKNKQSAPEIDMNIGMDARKIPQDDIENFYEVVFNIKASAKRGDQTMFIIELLYGAAVSIDKNVKEELHHPFLFIEIPRLMFPYVRKLVSDLTAEGGYQPLILNPIDFQALYMKNFAQNQGEKPEEKAQEG